MALGGDSYVLGFAAGVLSSLSPCVLPLLPVVVGSALAAHRLGAAALAAGLALTFFAVGLFVAAIGFEIGLDGDLFRLAGAVMLALLGIVLMSATLQTRFTVVAERLGLGAGSRLAGFVPSGLAGQFLVGALLGIVWSPCVGPTLGAASLIAAEGRDLGQVAGVMLLFAFGAALPLVLVGLASRELMMRWRGRLLAAGRAGKAVLGGAMVAIALAVATGADRQAEAWLTAASPAWLTDLATRF